MPSESKRLKRRSTMKKSPLAVAGALVLWLISNQTTRAQANTRITCDGILIEVDMTAGADFPMAVVYDNSNPLATHTCVLDVGHAGHWPLRGACEPGERCKLTGPYFKKIGNTYYMRTWDKAEFRSPKE
jgi:hypothetical protein